MKKHLRKILSLFLIACMLSGTMSTAVYAFDGEEKPDYAEIILGDKIQTTNIGNYFFADAGKFVVESAGGKKGMRTDRSNRTYYLYVDIADDFMYNLPKDSPLYLEVEYFDGDPSGWFNLQYDSSDPPATFAGTAGGNQKATDMIYLTGTNQWKTHTFYLPDFAAANRVGSADFLLAIWTPPNEKSPIDILFSSVKVYLGDYDTPVKIDTLNTGCTGNLMTSKDATALHLPMTNRMDSTLTVDYDMKVFDADENLLEEMTHSCELAPNEVRTDKVPFKNPGKHGLYTIKVHSKVRFKDEPDRNIMKPEEDRTVKFSVSLVTDTELRNGDFGWNNETAFSGYGDVEKVAEILKKSGSGWIRDNLGAAQTVMVDGVYRVNEKSENIFRELKASGANIVVTLFSLVSGQGIPDTTEELELWSKWCEGIVEQLADYIDVWEVWNEPNLKSFNPPQHDGKVYARFLEYAYKAIKKHDPDSIVLGLSCAGLNEKYTRDCLEAGGGQYMDAISTHTYDWTGYFNEAVMINESKNYRKIVDEYVPGMPIWLDEYGFSTYLEPISGGTPYSSRASGHTPKEQYQNFVLSMALMQAHNLYEKTMYYCMFDRGPDRHDIEENWGLFNYFDKEKEESPYSAKLSYLGVVTYNHFMNSNTSELESFISDTENRVYAFNYYNSALSKNVALLQAGDATVEKMTIDLGCASVDIYDGFGNYIGKLPTKNGKFTMVLNKEPYYIVGDFKKFERVQNDTMFVEVDPLETVAVGNDTVTYTATKNINSELVIEVDGIEVVSNPGFVGNTAKLQVKVPDKMSGEKFFTINIKDKNGKLYYTREHKISMTTPVSISVDTELADKFSSNIWRIKVTVKNMCIGTSISGTYSVTDPENIVKANKQRTFKNLKPQSSLTYVLNVPEKVNKNLFDLNSSIRLDNGYEEAFTHKIDFTMAQYAKTKPVIDGVVSKGEWSGSWIGTDSFDDVFEDEGWTWDSPDDLSFNGLMMWDEDNFYYMGILRDDVDFTDCTAADPSYLWHGDSFQIGIDDRVNINVAESQSFMELGLAKVPGAGNILWRYNAVYDPNMIGTPITTAETEIKRYDGYTVYECAIPWDEIFYPDYVVNPENPMRLSVLANDNDGNGRGFIEYSSGIGTAKRVDLFATMKLVK